jgi:hypothetical protein
VQQLGARHRNVSIFKIVPFFFPLSTSINLQSSLDRISIVWNTRGRKKTHTHRDGKHLRIEKLPTLRSALSQSTGPKKDA